MEIPLVLSSPRPERLVYALPIWYRVMMACLLAIVATALFMTGSTPGFLAWSVLILLLLGGLYEDKWVFDAGEERATHRAGLMVAARSMTIPFAEIECFHIVPIIKGTVPGSEDEKQEKASALKGSRMDDGTIKRERHKKPFLSLEIEGVDGTRYLVDHLPARRTEALRALASRLAAHCEKPISEG